MIMSVLPCVTNTPKCALVLLVCTASHVLSVEEERGVGLVTGLWGPCEIWLIGERKLEELYTDEF